MGAELASTQYSSNNGNGAGHSPILGPKIYAKNHVRVKVFSNEPKYVKIEWLLGTEVMAKKIK
jgi:hypothetical protein